MNEFPDLIISMDQAERAALEELSSELSKVLREMEDYQIKVLALQAQAEFIQMSIQEILEGRRLARFSKEKSL